MPSSNRYRLWTSFLIAPIASRNWWWTAPVRARKSTVRRAVKPSPFRGNPPRPRSEVAAPTGQPVNPIAASAAAKIEKHLKVPVRDKPSELLIKKADAPLEVVTKGADKKIRLHTIRHATCFESGHDRFDEKVTEFLSEVGEANLISVHVVNYTYVDIASQKTLSDFGVLIVYRG